MPRFLSVWLLGLLCASFAHAGSLWFSDAQGIHRIDTDTNVVAQHVPHANVAALALDARDGGVWVLGGGRLARYDATGIARVDLDAQAFTPAFASATRLALDPSDGSVWVGSNTHVLRFAGDGALLAAFASPSPVQDIAIAQDHSLWVLGRTELSRFTAQGLAGRAPIAGDLQQAAFIAIDEGRGVLWLGGAKMLAQVALGFPLQAGAVVATDDVVDALAFAPDSGLLWVLGHQTLSAYGAAGTRAANAPLAGARGLNPQAIAYEAQGRGLWVGHQGGISRYDTQARHVLTLGASVKVNAIGVATSGIVPIVTLVSPADGTLSIDPRLPIRVHYDATCFGQPCGYPSSEFAAYVLRATLNGQAIGHLFQFDPATNDAVYVPAGAHPEGSNELSAFVTDRDGRRSATVTARFTIDTLAPNFLSLTPPDGSVFTTPNVTLRGSLDDLLGRVFLESFSGTTIGGANPAGASFEYALGLQPGTNALRITASDLAGNARSLSFSYVFSTLTLAVASPADGALVDDDKVTVSGTFSGAATATITVNGRPASVTGNSFVAADVPLVPGLNTLTVQGTTPQGAQATRTLRVTSLIPTITLLAPAAGSSVNADRVLVRGRIEAASGSGVSVNGGVAIVDAGNNFFANAVRLDPGSNTITATVTTPTGKQRSAGIVVSSPGPAPIVVTATPMQGAAPHTVAFSLENRAGIPLSAYQFNAGGFATVGAPTQPGEIFTLTYPQAGTYQATVTVVDAGGNPFAQAFVVQVRDPADMDQMFRAIWNGMNAALVAGDKARAMGFLTADAQAKYGPVFDALMADLPQIVASYSPLQRVSLAARTGEYAINRTLNGVNRIFLIYFLQDENGVWLVDAM